MKIRQKPFHWLKCVHSHDLCYPLAWEDENLVEIRELGIGDLSGCGIIDEGHISEPADYRYICGLIRW